MEHCDWIRRGHQLDDAPVAGFQAAGNGNTRGALVELVLHMYEESMTSAVTESLILYSAREDNVNTTPCSGKVDYGGLVRTLWLAV